MNKQLKFVIICLLATVMTTFATSCDDSVKDEPKVDNVGIELSPKDKSLEIDNNSIEIVFTEVNTGMKYTFKNNKTMYLPTGLYNINVTANIKGDSSSKLVGQRQNLEVKDNLVVAIGIDLIKVSNNRDFVIEEIFYTGTELPNASITSYIPDQYFKITNNSDKVLYADSLLIMESDLVTTKDDKITPENFIQEGFATKLIFMIPGNGKEHPVNPGESIILCDVGNNFTKEYSESVDLSKASFEWYQPNMSSPFSPDVDTDVPNLTMVYMENPNYPFRINVNGIKAYAIGRIKGMSIEKFIETEKKEYSYKRTLPNGRVIKINSKPYVLPANMIIDLVTLAQENEYKRQVAPIELDKSFTFCSKDATVQYGKSVIRKVDDKLSAIYGHKVLVDTNSSTDDFVISNKPSIKK